MKGRGFVKGTLERESTLDFLYLICYSQIVLLEVLVDMGSFGLSWVMLVIVNFSGKDLLIEGGLSLWV